MVKLETMALKMGLVAQINPRPPGVYKEVKFDGARHWATLALCLVFGGLSSLNWQGGVHAPSVHHSSEEFSARVAYEKLPPPATMETMVPEALSALPSTVQTPVAVVGRPVALAERPRFAGQTPQEIRSVHGGHKEPPPRFRWVEEAGNTVVVMNMRPLTPWLPRPVYLASNGVIPTPYSTIIRSIPEPEPNVVIPRSYLSPAPVQEEVRTPPPPAVVPRPVAGPAKVVEVTLPKSRLTSSPAAKPGAPCAGLKGMALLECRIKFQL